MEKVLGVMAPGPQEPLILNGIERGEEGIGGVLGLGRRPGVDGRKSEEGENSWSGSCGLG